MYNMNKHCCFHHRKADVKVFRCSSYFDDCHSNRTGAYPRLHCVTDCL